MKPLSQYKSHTLSEPFKFVRLPFDSSWDLFSAPHIHSHFLTPLPGDWISSANTTVSVTFVGFFLQL